MIFAFLETSQAKRKVIFIDEISWIDTQKSGFLTALEHFWNGWACSKKELMLIVCGSATSWIINNLINNIGGLYNRVTASIQLFPFTLNETELFLRANQYSAIVQKEVSLDDLFFRLFRHVKCKSIIDFCIFTALLRHEVV